MTDSLGPGASIDALIATLYDCVSGPSESPRPWAQFRTCFWPGARLMPVRALSDGFYADIFDVESYIASRTPYFEKNDFFESELARKTWSFGSIALVLSEYGAKRFPGGPSYLHGVNSMQLFHDASRWWFLSIAWDNEAATDPLPAELLLLR